MVPSDVHTADPSCQFVDPTYGMSGSSAHCANANADVHLFAPVPVSSFGNKKQLAPQSDAQLNKIAAIDGCLYSGPTQVTLTHLGIG